MIDSTSHIIDDRPIARPGHTTFSTQRVETMQQSLTLAVGLEFNVSATFTPGAAPSLSGSASLSLELTDETLMTQVKTGQYQVDGTGAIVSITGWGLSVYRHRISMSGDMTKGLDIGEAEKADGVGYHETTTVLSVPPPPLLTMENVLDAVQFGLDVAGLVPGVGEAADATSAIISVARGNTGEAMISLAAMIPFFGAGATGGKFAAKAAKALAKQADKLDEVVDAGKQLAPAGQIAQQLNGPMQRLSGQNQTIANMRPYAGRLNDITVSPNRWKVVRSSSEASTNLRNKAGTSMQELLRNDETGETIVRHTLLKANGSIFEPSHFRPFWK